VIIDTKRGLHAGPAFSYPRLINPLKLANILCVLQDKIHTEVIKRLKAKGARMTQKRQRILNALTTFDRPASAEEIRERAELPPTDLVTVYRNLETFQSIEALQSIPLENGTNLFELISPGEHYHHLICRNCHKTDRLDVCIGHDIEDKAKAKGYSVITHVLEVYGLCDECGV
jgi:Fur family transcriptional regulator, ferric uptake regulator